MKTHKLAFVDLEMTGLDPAVHEIIEIGCVLAEQKKDRTGKLYIESISEHEFQLIPQHIETADPKGLEVNHYHERDWSKAVHPKEALSKFSELVDGYVFVAQNVAIDWMFLAKIGNDYGIDFDKKLHYHRLDLAS